MSSVPVNDVPRRGSGELGGALAAAASLPWLVLARLDLAASSVTLAWAVAIGASLLWVSAALAVATRPGLGRRLALLSLFGTLGLATPIVIKSPLLALCLLVLVSTLVAILQRATAPGRLSLGEGASGIPNPRAAAMVALALWTLVQLSGRAPGQIERVALSVALSIPAAMLFVALLREPRSQRARWVALAVAVQCVMVTWAFTTNAPGGVLNGAIMLPIAALLLPAAHARDTHNGWLDSMLGHPERLFVGTFASLCAIGTLALWLPQAAANGRNIDILDALFTAVSAVCVTGLAVLDTPHDFSLTGQVMLLLLIQTGGLGIMTFSTAALRMFGGRMSLRHESAVASLISDRDSRQLYGSAQRILAFTLGCELVGAAWLSITFRAHGDSWIMAAWRGVFTSVSAFCNAGFALQSDSLVSYQHDPAVLHMVGLLILVGGLSPAAVLAIPTLARRLPTPVTLQIKLSLVATAVLLLVGFVAILAFEWDHSLAHLRWDDRVHNALFQSITLRTAGFNSIDLTVIRPATLSLMIVWMFIGGSPGGTAGGIKTTTAAILFLAVGHAMRGQWGVSAFGRRVADRSLRKATVVMTLAVSTVVSFVIVLQLTQNMPIEVGVFEVVSALGTVGLSIGGTAQLDGVGKVLVTACMFVGRVGGLSVLMFLSQRRPRASDGYLEQDVDVG